MPGDNPEQLKNDTKAKFPIKAIIGIILIFTCLYFANAYYSKSSLLRFAKKELVAKGYEVIDVKILEYSSATRQKEATGKIAFAVKDRNGNRFDGKATIKSEKKWLILNKQSFEIDEIKKK